MEDSQPISTLLLVLRVLTSILCVPALVAGIPGNLLVLVVVAKECKASSFRAEYWVFASLALADCLMCLVIPAVLLSLVWEVPTGVLGYTEIGRAHV